MNQIGPQSERKFWNICGNNQKKSLFHTLHPWCCVRIRSLCEVCGSFYYYTERIRDVRCQWRHLIMKLISWMMNRQRGKIIFSDIRWEARSNLIRSLLSVIPAFLRYDWNIMLSLICWFDVLICWKWFINVDYYLKSAPLLFLVTWTNIFLLLSHFKVLFDTLEYSRYSSTNHHLKYIKI